MCAQTRQVRWKCGWDLEREVWASGARRVAGVDEVGRGPLFGPVTAAAVILPAEFAEKPDRLCGLKDSKQLKEADRERLVVEIRSVALAWAVAEVDVATIDRLNIREATRLAMRQALAELQATARVDFALVDGNCAVDVTGLGCGQRTVVSGDARSVSIAAASVVAKVHRDALLRQMDTEFPGYGLARHKGYGTPEHLAALRRLGPTSEHRLSFAPVRAVCAPQML
jgi:ribonuclease HII